MKIFIGADHRGFNLKNYLIEALQGLKFVVVDCGNKVLDPADDFTDFANKVAQQVGKNSSSVGILICGSGAGVSITANKIKGVYCAIAINPAQIKSAKEHDNINCLALASDHITNADALKCVEEFINTKYLGQEKQQRRIGKLKEIEEQHVN